MLPGWITKTVRVGEKASGEPTGHSPTMCRADRPSQIRILAVEELSLARSGLIALFTAAPDVTVAAEAEHLAKAVPLAVEVRPDVTVLSVRSLGSEEVEVVTALHEELPDCRVLFVASRRPGDLRRAMAAHACGYLLADAPSEDIVDAVRRIARGERVVDTELACVALATAVSPLTVRELDVLQLAAQGDSYGEIARRLCLSVRTIRNHMSRIIGKTGARNRVDAIRIADDAGWL